MTRNLREHLQGVIELKTISDKSGSYDARFTQFYDAFKAKHPKLQLIATDRAAKTRTPDLYDDHFYPNAEGFYKKLSHYDKMDRKGPKVFVGEWATREGDPTPNFNGALGDSAWMTSMERNSDLVVMQCYAPLFVNINPGAMRWAPDLIGYNGLESYGSPAYYAQVMFANHVGDVTPKSELKAAVFLPYSVTRQTATGKVFLKVVNPSATAHMVKIELNGLNKVQPNGEAITLSASGPKETNTITEPKKIVPVTTPLKNVAPTFDHTFPAWSITVLELNTQSVRFFTTYVKGDKGGACLAEIAASTGTPVDISPPSRYRHVGDPFLTRFFPDTDLGSVPMHPALFPSLLCALLRGSDFFV